LLFGSENVIEGYIDKMKMTIYSNVLTVYLMIGLKNLQETIKDPKMQIVREKATKALELILASDGKEYTVEIME